MAAPARALLAADLDRTLLDEDDAPAPGIAALLGELRERGVPLIVCTGRPYDTTLRGVAALGTEAAGLVCYHGAAAVDAVTGEWVRRIDIPPAAAAGLAGQAAANGLAVSVYSGAVRFELDGRAAAPAGWDADTWAGTTRLVLAGDPPAVDAAAAAVASAWGAVVRLDRVRPGALAAVSAAADKGEGLRLFAARAGVPPERVVACGDGLADVSLLRAAGFGVAVGDAPEALRRVAAAVVPQDGLAAALREAFDRLL